MSESRDDKLELAQNVAEDDEIAGSQSGMEVDTEPVLSQAELQNSCETYMSQQSHMRVQKIDRCLIITSNPEGSLELEEDISREDAETSAETSNVNSSLEVEANNSAHNISLPEPQVLEEVDPNPPQDEHRSEEVIVEAAEQDNNCWKSGNKRKERSDDSSPEPKKPRQSSPILLEPTEDKSKDELVEEEPVVNISSTPEKTIILDDSQEYSLRFEDTSPPTSQKNGEKLKKSEESESWESHSKEKNIFPSLGSLSQKSSWNSHDNSLSWSSHKEMEDKYAGIKKENEDLKKELAQLKNESLSPERAKGNADSERVREVMDSRVLCAIIQWTIDNNTNKVLSGQIKQVSLMEESQFEKPGRMSILSSTSHKSSSSSGSVGLPGPFPLPGHTRLSATSSVSSSSSGIRPGWDGPFLKPSVPGSKAVGALSCGICCKLFPPFERTSSPVLNGSPKLSDEEELQIKPLPTRRPRKGTYQSQSTSGTIEEETSSSGSQTQTSSTPTPSRPRGRPRKNAISTLQKTPKNEAKPRRTKTPASVRTPVTPVQSPAYGEAKAVLAKWADGHYYPGWVTQAPNTSQQVMVHFCDGKKKLTPISKVVSQDIVTPGALILAATDTGHYEEALIVQLIMGGPELEYKVERGNVDRIVKFSSIALLESQVTELTLTNDQKEAASINSNNVSLDNILHSTRKRSVRTPLSDLKRNSPTSAMTKRKKRQITPEASTSHGQTFGGPDDYYLDTDSSTHSTCSVDLRGKEVRPLDMECSPPEVDQDSRLKLSHYRRNITKSKKKQDEPEHLVKLLGPIPEAGSELFAGCNFFITYTQDVDLHRVYSECTSSLEDSSGAERGKKVVPPVWKERLRTQIKNGGGKVFTDLNHVPKEELTSTYLITDKPCSTPLYLQCLVTNIPIYSNSLIIQCCTQKRPFKELLSMRGTKQLSAGYSLAKGCVLTITPNCQPLQGKTLLLALTGDSSLSNFWESLVKKMGGTTATHHGGCLSEQNFDVIVTDADCDRDLVAQACEQQIPLVSLIWLQQCIINADYLSPTEHHLYKYNASVEENSPEY